MRRKLSKSLRNGDKAPALVAVETWFSRKMKENRLKIWQLAEIKNYFRNHGLSERETLEDFEKIFRKFEGVM